MSINDDIKALDTSDIVLDQNDVAVFSSDIDTKALCLPYNNNFEYSNIKIVPYRYSRKYILLNKIREIKRYFSMLIGKFHITLEKIADFPFRNDIVCKVVTFTGRVQGVCFRWYTENYAIPRNIDGVIWNSIDGSVVGIFYGNSHSISRLISKHLNGEIANSSIITGIEQLHYEAYSAGEILPVGFKTIEELQGWEILNMLNEEILCRR